MSSDLTEAACISCEGAIKARDAGDVGYQVTQHERVRPEMSMTEHC